MAGEDKDKMLEELSEDIRGARERWNPACSEDIGLRIRADGVWLYRESPIERPALVRLFASVLRCEADGAHYLVTPVEKVPIAVDDAPFVAVGLDVEGRGKEQRLVFRTNVGETVVAGPAHPIRFVVAPPDGGLKPYLRVRDSLEALVARSVYLDLVPLIVMGPRGSGDAPRIWSGGAFFPLPDGAFEGSFGPR